MGCGPPALEGIFDRGARGTSRPATATPVSRSTNVGAPSGVLVRPNRHRCAIVVAACSMPRMFEQIGPNAARDRSSCRLRGVRWTMRDWPRRPRRPSEALPGFPAWAASQASSGHGSTTASKPHLVRVGAVDQKRPDARERDVLDPIQTFESDRCEQVDRLRCGNRHDHAATDQFDLALLLDDLPPGFAGTKFDDSSIESNFEVSGQMLDDLVHRRRTDVIRTCRRAAFECGTPGRDPRRPRATPADRLKSRAPGMSVPCSHGPNRVSPVLLELSRPTRASSLVENHHRTSSAGQGSGCRQSRRTGADHDAIDEFFRRTSGHGRIVSLHSTWTSSLEEPAWSCRFVLDQIEDWFQWVGAERPSHPAPLGRRMCSAWFSLERRVPTFGFCWRCCIGWWCHPAWGHRI